MRFFLISALIFLGSVSAFGEDAATPPSPTLDQSFLLLPSYDLERVAADSKKSVRVGDVLDFKIGGLTDPNVTVEPAPGDGEVDDKGWDIEITRDHLRATPLKAGELTIPSLGLKDASGKFVARTNPLPIQVASAIAPNDPNKDQPAELAPPVGMKFPIWVVVCLSILGLIFLGLLIYGIIYLIKKSQKPAYVPPPIQKTEDQLALDALLELEKSSFFKSGKFKLHYFRVSEILKNYIGSRYDFDAPESTTHELVTVLEREKGIKSVILDDVESLFEHMDVVKFTDHVPSDQDSQTILVRARELVIKTRRANAP